jgi:hypothetical protein
MSRVPQHMTTGDERPSWTDRNEQLTEGFREVACGTCSTTVLVRKMSLAQTSVQWPSSTACPFLMRDPAGTPAESCAHLRQSIWDAVESGALPVEPQ